MSGMSPEEVIELKHTLSNIAELLAEYSRELRGQGFNRREALAITIAWQNTLLSQSQGKDSDS